MTLDTFSYEITKINRKKTFIELQADIFKLKIAIENLNNTR